MKKNRIAARLLSLVLLAAAVLTGCSSQNSDQATEATAGDLLARIQEKGDLSRRKR